VWRLQCGLKYCDAGNLGKESPNLYYHDNKGIHCIDMLKYGILFLFVQYGIYRIEPCSTLNYQTFDTGYII